MKALTDDDKYQIKEIVKRTIYMFYPKIMDELGLDNYGIISIHEYDNHPHKEKVLETNPKFKRWMMNIYNDNKIPYMHKHYDIIYNTDVMISSFREYDTEQPIFSLDFCGLCIIAGLAHELRHAWQFINCCYTTDEEMEHDAMKFSRYYLEKIKDDPYDYELILNLIRTFSNISLTGLTYHYTSNHNSPITRTMKEK